MDREGKAIVHRVDEGVDPRDVYCTTYQMRNFYQQMGDGYFTPLDVMNYVQHYKAVKMMRAGMRVLDVCCGRSLLLPMMRYHAKEVADYVGVDISAKNIQEAKTRPGLKPITVPLSEHYPFPVRWVEADVADMTAAVGGLFDFVVYTSAIEHMHKDAGLASLRCVYDLMRPGATMFLSCPRTEGDGYDTQYRAHVYEWGLQELRDAMAEIGFTIDREVGLIVNKRDLDAELESVAHPAVAEFCREVCAYVPREFACAVLAAPFPHIAKEVLLIVRKPVDKEA